MPAPKGVDTAKYDRCVEDVKRKGTAQNAYAVCASSLKKKGSKSKSLKKIAASGAAVEGMMDKNKKKTMKKAKVIGKKPKQEAEAKRKEERRAGAPRNEAPARLLQEIKEMKKTLSVDEAVKMIMGKHEVQEVMPQVPEEKRDEVLRKLRERKNKMKKSLVDEIMDELGKKEFTKDEFRGMLVEKLEKAVTSQAAVADNSKRTEEELDGENKPTIQDAKSPEDLKTEGSQEQEITESKVPKGINADEAKGGKVKFSKDLFNEIAIGSTLRQGPTGNVMANMKAPSMDYVKQYEQATNQESYVRNEKGEIVKRS